VCLLLTIDGAGTVFPLLATVFAACKFALLAVAIAYLLAGLAMRLRPPIAAAGHKGPGAQGDAKHGPFLPPDGEGQSLKRQTPEV